jgi:UDP-N-acetylmuramoyl-L-alanyl-D-glutamate--2,6-diaminopimelate ligase
VSPPAAALDGPPARAGEVPADRGLRELLRDALPGATLPRGADPRILSVEDDSREAGPGALFVAVPGTKADGAAFAAEAVRRGAAAVVAERPLDLAVPVVVVPDARAAAAALAAAFHGRPALALDLVGVTGTNGKTTTAYLLHAVLEAAGRRAGLLGTVEYRVGARRLPAENTTPGAVRLQRLLAGMRDAGCAAAAMEVSSHALHQGRVAGLPFRAAVFTNLTGDHLDYHGSMEAYRDAKGLLFESLAPDAFACLHAADPVSGHYAARTRARVLRFGLVPGAEVTLRDAVAGPDGIEGTLVVPGGSAPLRSPLLGRHNIENLLSAAAGAFALGLPAEVLAPGLGSLRGVPGRLERVDDGSAGFRVLVDYAHTEDALRRVLGFLRPLTPGRILAVAGCGGDRDRTKRPRMGRALAELADLAILTSDNPRSEDPLAILAAMRAGVPPGIEVREIPDRREAIACAVRLARPGDTVLVAGKGHETVQILRHGTVPFDDREAAREALGIPPPRAPG